MRTARAAPDGPTVAFLLHEGPNVTGFGLAVTGKCEHSHGVRTLGIGNTTVPFKGNGALPPKAFSAEETGDKLRERVCDVRCETHRRFQTPSGRTCNVNLTTFEGTRRGTKCAHDATTDQMVGVDNAMSGQLPTKALC